MSLNPVLDALLRAYTDAQVGQISFRMRTLIEEIARQINNGLSAGGAKHYVAQSVGGDATNVTCSTGANLLVLNQFDTLFIQPVFNNVGAVNLSIDGLAPVAIKMPTGAVPIADEFNIFRFYQLMLLGSPVSELRIMYGG